MIVNEKINDLKKFYNNVEGYILVNNGCIFSVLNKTNIKVIPFNAFYYHFSKLVNNKIISQNIIDELYEKIV